MNNLNSKLSAEPNTLLSTQFHIQKQIRANILGNNDQNIFNYNYKGQSIKQLQQSTTYEQYHRLNQTDEL